MTYSLTETPYGNVINIALSAGGGALWWWALSICLTLGQRPADPAEISQNVEEDLTLLAQRVAGQ